MDSNFFSNKVANNQKIERAQKDANKYAQSKMQPILDELNALIKEKMPEAEVPRSLWVKIDSLLGKQIALAHGVGFMKGLEKRKLYNASGSELL